MYRGGDRQCPRSQDSVMCSWRMPRRNPEWREGPKPTGEPWLAILHKEVRGLAEERDARAVPPRTGQTLGCRKGVWVEEMASAKALRLECAQQARLSWEMGWGGLRGEAVWISDAWWRAWLFFLFHVDLF